MLWLGKRSLAREWHNDSHPVKDMREERFPRFMSPKDEIGRIGQNFRPSAGSSETSGLPKEGRESDEELRSRQRNFVT